MKSYKEIINSPKLLFNSSGVGDFTESMQLVFLDEPIHNVPQFNHFEIKKIWEDKYKSECEFPPFDLWNIDIPSKSYPIWLCLFSHSHEYGKIHRNFYDLEGGFKMMFEYKPYLVLSPKISNRNEEENKSTLFDEVDIKDIPFNVVKFGEKKVVRDAPKLSTHRNKNIEDVIESINKHILECKTPSDIMALYEQLKSVVNTVKSCEKYMYGNMDSSAFYHPENPNN